ncbi:MAG: hypothetical protein JXR70_05440 [Spirochaetales bacterium]|nr:hypothetical protein [Spirochaetales bacterium]
MLVAVISGFKTHAQTNITDFDWDYSIRKDWHWTPSNDSEYSTMNLQPANMWHSVNLPLRKSDPKVNEILGENPSIWLRKEIVFSPALEGKDLYFLTRKTYGAIKFYLNDILIGKSGGFPPNFQFFSSTPKQCFLPPELIRYGETNMIALYIYNPRGDLAIPDASIGGYDRYIFDSQLVTFFNLQIYTIFTVLCLVLFLYYFVQFLWRRSDTNSLLFSLINFCFGMYFLAMGLEVNFIPFEYANSFSQSFFPLFFGLLTVFFVRYFNIHNNKWLKRITMVKSIFLSFLFYVNIFFNNPIQGLFNMAIIPGALELFFQTYVATRATIKGNRDGIPLMIGALCGVVLGLHDMVYQVVLQSVPFAWLQGPGIFIFNLSMFYSLTQKNVKMYNNMELYSKEIEQKTNELEKYIKNISDISSVVTNMSAKIENSISSTSDSVNRMASGSEVIKYNIEKQFDVVKTTTSTILDLLGSLDITYQGIHTQLSNVQNTSETINSMLETIDEVTKDLKETAEFTSHLEGITQKGDKAIKSSVQSINQIKDVSQKVKNVVAAVNDIAEQTNILSINAAIEAAHAGVYGRGFAIVASEIKRLAEGSGNRSREIDESIKNIIDRISVGVETNKDMQNIFNEINDNTTRAVSQVQHIYELVAQQKSSSQEIQHSLQELKDSCDSIKGQTEKQGDGSNQIRTNMEGLVKVSQDVFDNITSISQEINGVIENIASLRKTSEESNQVIIKLQNLIKENRSTE